MKLILKISFLFIAGLATVIPQAKDKPIASKGDLQFYIDCASFKGQRDKIYQEFYVMIYADQLKLKNESESKIATLKIEYVLSDKNNNQIDTKDWVTDATFTNEQDIRSLVVYDQWNGELIPGEYKLSVRIVDQNSRLSGRAESEINIHGIKSGQIGISSIQFINGLSDGNELNNTGGKSLIPNPSRRYGILNPGLAFYFEISGADSNAGLKAEAAYVVTNTKNEIVKELREIPLLIEGNTKGLSQAINISSLQTGIYNLQINITDSTGNSLTETQRQFEIIQADYLSGIPLMNKDEYEILAGVLEYLATPVQMSVFNNLNSSGKSYFIIRFFREKDPVPETAENEYLQAMIARFQYANQNFGYGNVEGWATDRGRIMIQNGKPDDIENHSFETGFKPYEIWYYRTNREINYVFGDFNGDGNFVLLHSNNESEIHNSEWSGLLRKY